MTDNPLTRYMTERHLSSSQLAALIKADGIKGIGAVTIRQWMCEGHRPYRTAIGKLVEADRLREDDDKQWGALCVALQEMVDGGEE